MSKTSPTLVVDENGAVFGAAWSESAAWRDADQWTDTRDGLRAVAATFGLVRAIRSGACDPVFGPIDRSGAKWRLRWS